MSNVFPHTIVGVLGGVIHPVLSRVQDDDTRLLPAYRMYIKVSTLIIGWICMFLLAMGDPAVALVYGVDWMGCAVFVKIAAFGVAVDHISSINMLMIKGRANLLLGLEIVKKSASVAMLNAATISVEASCWASVIYIHIAIYINSYFVGKITGLTWWKQQKDYMPYVIWAAWFCSLTEWLYVLQLAVGGGSAFLLYFGGLHLWRDAAYLELYRMLRQRLGDRWLPAL